MKPTIAPKSAWLAFAALLASAAGLGGCAGGSAQPAAPAGRPASQTQVALPVEGMTCGGCEVAIEMAVGRLEGVQSVEADHETGTVEIVFDRTRLGLDAIAETIRKLGYRPQLEALQDAPAQGGGRTPTGREGA